MSFARFYDPTTDPMPRKPGQPPRQASDVYVFPNEADEYECCMCRLDSLDDYYTPDAEAMVAHLDQHEAAGHAVPDYTRDAIRQWAAREETP